MMSPLCLVRPTVRFVTHFCVTVLLSTLIAAPAFALPDKMGWAGGLFGLSVPNADNSSARSIYGVTVGGKLGDEYGIGGYYLTSKKDEDVNSQKSAFDYDLFGIEATYHFEGEAAGAFFGARLGTSKVKGGALSTSPLNYGAVVGVDKLLGELLSIGAELSWMGVQSSSGTVNGQSATIPAFSMLNFLVSLKLWF